MITINKLFSKNFKECNNVSSSLIKQIVQINDEFDEKSDNN